MRKQIARLWTEQGGATYTIEILLVSTLVIIGSAVGLGRIRIAVANELNDVANAVGSLNQSYIVPVLDVCACRTFAAGNGFLDQTDECDCNLIDMCGKVKDHNGTLDKNDATSSQG